MDLRGLRLHFAQGDVRARVADAAGEREVRLEGTPAGRTLTAALPLLSVVEAAAGGRARTLALDFVARVAWVGTAASSGQPDIQVGLAALAATPALAHLARSVLVELRARRPENTGEPLDAAFWSALYRDGGDGWELGRAAPPLARWTHAHDVRGLRTLVPGCGRGHEARLLAAAGARVTAIDFSAEAIAAAQGLAAAEGREIDFQTRDLFALPEAPARYDLIVEHCCFGAVDPERRPAYARVAAAVLAPGGTFVGLFWAHGRPGGPPYSTSAAELRERFVPPFTLRSLESPPDSVGGRIGQELLLELTLLP
jgi:SAM-dependent methyltransferase